MNYRRLNKVGLNILYFSTFILTTVPAHLLLICFFLFKPTAPRKVYLYLALCIAYLFFVILISSSDIPLRNLLFYFSFVMPFLVMLSTKDSVNQFAITDGFMVVVCAVTIAEAILINGPLGPHVWFLSGEKENPTKILYELYQRPFGVAGGASASGAVVVFSLVLSDSLRMKWSLLCTRNFLATLTLIILASGTGFMMFTLYLAIKMFSSFINTSQMKSARGILLICFITFILWGTLGGFALEGFNKYTIEYALYVLETKTSSLVLFEASDSVELLFGGQVSSTDPTFSTSSDFGYLGMLASIGVLGSILVLGAPLLFFQTLRFFAVPTIFFYLCFVHYPALSSPPGAVLFALYLYMLSSYGRVGQRRTNVAMQRETFA